jgi:hypothetical protein
MFIALRFITVDVIYSLGYESECSIPANNFSNESMVVLLEQVGLNKTVDLVKNSLDFLGSRRF